MVILTRALIGAAIVALVSQVVAHPGHDLAQEIASRNEFFKHSKRNLNHCQEALRKRGLENRLAQRRQAAIAEARAARGLPLKRSLTGRDATSVSHLSSLDVTPTTSGVEEIIFSNSSCLLSPEGEEGPYYVKGEYVRSNVTETQPGVEVIIELQFVDVSTCEPIINLTSDIWHCNSTGVYSGVIATGNGNTNDLTNINKTFLRGLQTTDSDGVVQYSTIFPGHYSGRATHIHVESHLNGTILANSTYSGGSIAHIGQFFFDQVLITAVNQLSPYSTNTISVTENADDRVVQAELANNADPFLNYVLLGSEISDGLFTWITLGVNTSASYTSSPASDLTSSGGVAVSGSSSGSGSGNGTGGPGGSNGGPGGSSAVASGTQSVAGGSSSATTSAAVSSAATSAVSSSGANRCRQVPFFRYLLIGW